MPLWGKRIGAVEEPIFTVTKGIWRVQLSHAVPARSARLDDPNLVSFAGLVPAVALAGRADLEQLADRHLSVPGVAAGAKVGSLVAGMVEGAAAHPRPHNSELARRSTSYGHHTARCIRAY